MIAYFSKHDPTVRLLLEDGTPLAFPLTGHPDDRMGALVVGKQYWIDQIRAVIRKGVGGVSEITAEAYQELQKKKTPSSSLNFREQISAQQVRDGSRRYQDAKSAGEGKEGAVIGKNGKKSIQAIEHKPVKEGFKPESVKRP